MIPSVIGYTLYRVGGYIDRLQAGYCNNPRLLLIFIEIKPGNAIRTRSRAKASLFERPKIA